MLISARLVHLMCHVGRHEVDSIMDDCLFEYVFLRPVFETLRHLKDVLMLEWTDGRLAKFKVPLL